MLVLVATRDTQGQAEGDYCHTVEGELVTPITVECCLPDACGCARGFSGLVSAHATTTAMVVNRAAITPTLLRQSVSDSLVRGGSAGGAIGVELDEMIDEMIDEHVHTIVRVSKVFGEGAIVRRDGPAFWADVARRAA